MRILSNTLKKLYLNNDIRCQLILAFILGCIYLNTLMPGIGYSGDTTKFQYTGYVLGTPHWPGYPTYIITNYLFTHLLPYGTIAFKANLLSAFISVTVCLLLFNMLRNLFNINRVISTITSLFFGISFTMWSQSVIAEVYTLAMLFLNLFLLFLFQWRKTKSTAYFLMACAAYAFSFGNHIWMIILLPGFIYFVIATDKTVLKRPAIIGSVLMIIILAALQYGYIILRHYTGSPYLEINAPDIKAFFNSMNQMGVKGKFNFSAAKIFMHSLPLSLFFLIREFSILLPLCIWGLILIAGKYKHIAVFIIICFACNICFVLFYDIYDIFIYMLITYFLLALCLAFGIEGLITTKKLTNRKKAVYFILTAVITAIITYNIRYVSMRNETDKIQKTKNMIKIINRDAVVFSTGYFTTQCLNYYLITRNIAEQRNIYLFDQIFTAKNIALYIKYNFSIVNPKKPDIIIQPGLNVYLAMPFLKPPQLRYQKGSKFYRNYYNIMIKINNFSKNIGIDFVPESYKTISFPSRADKKKELMHDTLTALKESGLKTTEVTEDLYLITIDTDTQQP